MTPQIALDLSLDGIAVLSRAGDGIWWREGIVRLDAADMADGLTRLRARCAARVGEDFTTILIIPDSQLLFTSLERDDRDPKVTIRTLLRGRTPYDIEDLAFDYVQKGDRLQVAVVALETLMEAEEFAAGFGFQPIAVMGNPTDATYPGLPQFGPTGIAADLLKGERLVLDVDDGFDVIPAPNAPAMSDDGVDEPDTNAAEPADASPSDASDVAVPVALPDDTAPTDAEPAQDPDAPTFEETLAQLDPPTPPASVMPAALIEPTEPSEPDPIDDDIPAPLPPETPPLSLLDSGRPEPTLPAFSTRRHADPPAKAAPGAVRSGRITPRLSGPVPPTVLKNPSTEPPIQAPPAKDSPIAVLPAIKVEASTAPQDPPETAPTPKVAARVKTPRPVVPNFGFRRTAADAKDAGPVPIAAEDQDLEAAALALPGLMREKAARPRKGGGAKLGLYLTLSLLALMAIVAIWSVLQGNGAATVVATDPATTAPLVPLPAPNGTAETDATRIDDDVASLLPTTQPDTSTEGPGLADTDAIVAPPIPIGEAGVAALRSEDAEGTGETGTVSTDDTAAPETFETAGTFDEGPALPDVAVPQGGDVVIASVDEALAETETSPLPPAVTPDPAPVQEGPASPTPNVTQDATPETAPDAPVAVAPDVDGTTTPRSDAVAETEVESGPPPVAAPDESLVTASADGTLAPGGYTVFSGRPGVVPVQRASTTLAPLAAPEAAIPEVEPEETPERAALRRTQPVQRPETATPDAGSIPAPADDTPQIASGFTREELTRTRPAQRPETVNDAAAEQIAEAARVAAAAASDERSAAVEAAAAAAVASLASQATAGTGTLAPASGPTSALALAASERPQTRPRSVERDAARIVTQRREQATPAAASTQPAPTPAAAQSSQTIRSAGGSVARAATQQNAIRLRDINVIGIYGRPNARRALVRLANGRYVKVEVGDRLDRGRVTAIGDTQVVYQRGGRNVALTLPNS
ncbi:hypothetical protein [Jannaschia donghaensis]|uniref:Type IV pilus biogenesis n=1 Tax=Jannaschia donghaensis TaxID=420998 RepID=A0A0M6YEF7_9RHOB|nr:hypothetical protein [Jannaschia donghaensis]CTQ48731.1 Type IV pilus biogenesis [Jannaschia donghaensis]